MRTHRNAILCIAAVAALILVADVAFAQKVFNRGPSSNIGAGGPARGGGGYRGCGVGGPGVLLAIPQMGPTGGQYIDDDADVPQGAGRPPQRSTRRGPSG